jgi:DNA gyrase subunit A
VEASPDERAAYIKYSRNGGDEGEGGEDEAAGDVALAPERLAAMAAAEQVVLTVSANGYGKRTSAYEYRITNRGGKGIVAMVVNERNGPLVASFPVVEEDEIMVVTDGGQLIRCPVDDIRKAGRNTQGVIVINVAEDEHVVSVERLSEDGEGDDDA